MDPDTSVATSVRRELLERVLLSVRELGAGRDLDVTFERIVRDVVDVLGFTAAALNIRRPDDHLEVRAVAGPDGAKALLHTTAPLTVWTDLLDGCEPQGELRFLSHAVEPVQEIAEWTQESLADEVEGFWHRADALFAPLCGANGELLGVLSVDNQAGAPMPGVEQCTALELYAAQAAAAIEATAQRERLEQLHEEAEQRWRVSFEGGLVATGVLDEHGVITACNEAAAQMLGYSTAEIVGRGYLDLLHPDSVADSQTSFAEFAQGKTKMVAERTLLHRSGRSVQCLVHAAAASAGGRPLVILQLIDMTDRNRIEEQLQHQVTHDRLTDLPNRRGLEAALGDPLAPPAQIGVLYCEVDGFRTVADTLGHEAVDELLVGVSTRMQAALPAGALLAHVGHDQFVVVLTAGADAARLRTLGEQLLTALVSPIAIQGYAYTVRMSIGVAPGAPTHDTPSDVIQEADRALWRAKRGGGSRVEVFDPERDRLATLADVNLEHELRAAIEGERDLVPHFQSVISLMDGQTVGYEALLRWRHPQRGVLLPSEFVPLAERTGLAGALGWRALVLATENAAAIEGLNDSDIWVSVNISAAQLGRGALLAACRELLRRYPTVDPTRLRLEITETTLIDAAPALVDELYAIVHLGIRLALDDFGTGYSSLTLLRDLPLSAVKIDRSFVTPIAFDVRARTIVQHTIELVHGLGMQTVAEGIETAEQLGWLQTLGCGFGQGYLIDTPAPRGLTTGSPAWREPPPRVET